MAPIHPLWSVCLIVRFSIVALLLYGVVRRDIGTVILAIMGIGFMYKYFTSSPQKIEFQIAKVFWNADRPIHAILLIIAAVMYWNNNNQAAAIVAALSPIYSIWQRRHEIVQLLRKIIENYDGRNPVIYTS